MKPPRIWRTLEIDPTIAIPRLQDFSELHDSNRVIAVPHFIRSIKRADDVPRALVQLGAVSAALWRDYMPDGGVLVIPFARLGLTTHPGDSDSLETIAHGLLLGSY